MAAADMSEVILAELGAQQPPGTPSAVLDDLSVTIDRECAPEGVDEVALVPDNAAWVGRLRAIGVKKLEQWGLSALADSAELLISELVTNALKHGTGPEITFRIIIGSDTVVLDVDDGSPGRPQVRHAESDEESGRGMFLVAAFADSWGVSDDETRTWCKLTIPTEGTLS